MIRLPPIRIARKRAYFPFRDLALRDEALKGSGGKTTLCSEFSIMFFDVRAKLTQRAGRLSHPNYLSPCHVRLVQKII
jgi:hypothetical protein